ncbi:hypothetical protein ACFL35_15310 [Candidatus Riflebacteria bacterium]
MSFRINPKGKKHQRLVLLVDKKPFLDILEDAIPKNAKLSNWKEKGDATLIMEYLTETIKKSGEFHFFTCDYCSIPEDLILEPIEVIHQNDYVIWKVKPPGADVYYDKFDILSFKFHFPQYKKTILQMM